MPKKRELRLSVAERETLEEMRDHHPKAYLREREAGLLKTVAGWLNNYLTEGLGGLYVGEGRGRKPSYEP